MKEKVEVTRFAAKDNEGRVFSIVVYQYYFTQRSDDGHTVVVKGEMEYWTDTGLPVRQIDSDTFKIATTRETITRFY